MEQTLLTGSANPRLAETLVAGLGTPLSAVDIDRFPDGELHVEIQGLEALLDTHGLPVKKATLEKVRKQLAGVSALVDLWWQTVWQDLAYMAMPPRWTPWVEELLCTRSQGVESEAMFCRAWQGRADVRRSDW